MTPTAFESRHIGPSNEDIQTMLQICGETNLDDLISKTVPPGIRLREPMEVCEPMDEYSYQQLIRKLAAKNKVFRSYIGLGYYNTITPAPIQRNIFENPGWYTAYTPYQAEIAQGRLEALLNFQTMVMELTAMDLANASLLDEATAAAEAMHMFHAMRSKDQVQQGSNTLFIAEGCFPQTIDLLKTRSEPLGIDLVVGDPFTFVFDEKIFGAIIQFPDAKGEIHDFRQLAIDLKGKGIFLCACADLLSLVLLDPPGNWGADCVVGNTQRFGIPMGYGGPHAAFFATKEAFKRYIPGRIIGVSIDSQGNPALRMALQTREQHIKRDKATSNICTAQALLAIMASMYAVYHGPEGLRRIALKIHRQSEVLAQELRKSGFTIVNQNWFDTLTIKLNGTSTMEEIRHRALASGINFRYISPEKIGISLDETCRPEDITDILSVLTGTSYQISDLSNVHPSIPAFLARKTPFMMQKVFNRYHSETELMRYIKKLENRDLALNHSMIPLGSCTMKLNAASELIPLSFPEFASIHPFVPEDQAAGYHQIFRELTAYLSKATGFAAVSLQPNSGAQGEYAGLMVIRAYHRSKGDFHRNVALIPSSAHGTNPASAVMAGMEVIVVRCDEHGNVDISDLRAKAEQYSERLSSLMITYPSTHGVFEEGIREITSIIHQHGGLVYMDGANMNAQVGLTNPGTIGADVCHLNLHKTFAIPHGGGGPGMGPIGVNEKLAPFLPGHPLIQTGGDERISAVSAAPFGSSLILLVSYAYIKMLGSEGLTNSTKLAILNANYLKSKLEPHYPVLYKGKSGNVAHEMILDCRDFKRTARIEVADIAKRLMDYGYHAPTVSFPVPGTIMVEPTESESLEELDRFCEAMISIRNEIREIEQGQASPENNVIVNAPHTSQMVISDSWDKPYSREKAVFPVSWIRDNKFWPFVGKVDNAYGDRNLVCSCEPIESYMKAEAVL